MKSVHQTTLRQRVEITGMGVHSNAPVQMILHPADKDSGIVFLRAGQDGHEHVTRAHWSQVSMTELCTVIGAHEDASVSTIEHLLAACAALGVDNLLVEIDGPEVPIMDGSAAAFVEAIDQVGLRDQMAPRHYVKVLKPVRIDHGRGFSALLPADKGFTLDVEIDFSDEVIGHQRMVLELTPDNFRRELARARTFGFLKDVERLWQAGFALGASLENTVAVGEGRVLNPGGLRYSDEFVRHKMLDAVGDLALAGMPLVGLYRSRCGGHRMNVAILQALFSDPSAWTVVEGRGSSLRGRTTAGRHAGEAVAHGAAPMQGDHA